MKKKLIIWGGWWDKERPLSLETVDSHASVAAYFLTKYLSEFYDIVNVSSFPDVGRILEEKDAVAALSTFQCGFTKLPEKGKASELKKIKEEFRGKLCSVVDDIYRLKYNEDILFTVKPAKTGILPLLRRLMNRKLVIERCGWPADPEVCFPEPVSDRDINIFIDHSWYGGGLDVSRVYFDALKDIARDVTNFNINVYRQNNDGIVKWELESAFNEDGYLRTNKVPYLDIIKVYRRCSIFCVTHPESAGLAALEAAMCGAKLYVPSSFKGSFISTDLLSDGVEYRSVMMPKESIVSAFRDDLRRGIDRNKSRLRLLEKNTWKSSAAKIHSVLQNVA